MSGYSCAKRAADPSNEFAACRQWCGDMACVASTLNRERVRKYLETFEEMAEGGADFEASFQSMGWTMTPELGAALSIWRQCKDSVDQKTLERAKREAFTRLRAKFSTPDAAEEVLNEEESHARGIAG